MAVVYTVKKCVKYRHMPVILQLSLGLILILVCVIVPVLHMGLYRYLSGRLSKDMGYEPED